MRFGYELSISGGKKYNDGISDTGKDFLKLWGAVRRPQNVLHSVPHSLRCFPASPCKAVSTNIKIMQPIIPCSNLG